jgi:hypothetical protein
MVPDESLTNGDSGANGVPYVELTDALTTYRHLALTVIERAFRDLPAGACSPADRESARKFLVGSPIMRHWCRIAGLDPRRVIAQARALR